MARIHITFLGSGDAFFAQGRNQSAYWIQANSTCILLDCGAATLASLKHWKIAADSIDTIILSHLHGDHFAGLPFLFLEYTYGEGRTRPLRIAGPPGTERRIWELHSAMYGRKFQDAVPFRIEFTEMEPGLSLQIGALAIQPFRVPHMDDAISLGFIIAIEGRRILYSGDSGWTDELITRSQDTDLFICECSFYETRTPSHLDYPRILENLHRFGTKRLILTHLGNEVLAKVEGLDLELAHDGLRVEI